MLLTCDVLYFLLMLTLVERERTGWEAQPQHWDEKKILCFFKLWIFYITQC